MKINIFFIGSLFLIIFFTLSIKLAYKQEGMTDNYVKQTDFTFADTQYHDDIDTISKQPEIYGLPSGTSFVMGPDGKKYAQLIGNDIKTNFTYYKPGSRDQFGSVKYVPTYEDSIYLSKYNTGMRNSVYQNKE